MRKRTIYLTAGILAALALAVGCSGKTKSQAQTSAAQESQPAAETEGQPEAESQPEAAKPEETKPEEIETKDVEIGEAPVKIWGDITEVGDSTITVDNQSPVSSAGEIIFNIDSEYTYIVDGNTGLPVALPLVQPGAFEAYLGPAMTMSLPPQTTPYVVVVHLLEDASPAQYVIAARPLEDTDGGKILTAIDGAQYTLADSVEISPFLTRNIVVLEDIAAASRCLVWEDADGKVERIVLFAQEY